MFLMVFYKIVNTYLDKLICPEVQIFHKPRSAYKVCGYTGFALAIILGTVLVMHQSLSLWVITVLILTAVFTFFGFAIICKIIIGEERHTFYHNKIALIIVTIILLRLLHQPVLPYLGILILSIGLIQACGRIGCLMVGCCHGRPHHFGVCYREEHVASGFTPYYEGIRLFPIQAVESLWIFLVVIAGTMLILSGHSPAEALTWYIIAYGTGRFYFEFVRGDPERPYFLDFSEAQWISLFLMCAVVWAELSGFLIYHSVHIGATVCIALTMIVFSLLRSIQGTEKHKLLHPHHVKEVAEIVEKMSNETDILKSDPRTVNFPINCTSLGIQISVSKVRKGAGIFNHFALSYKNGIMGEEKAEILSRLLLQLWHTTGSCELVKGDQGVYHVLVHPY